MSASLQEQVRIARVNRMKRRAATAWHRAHCAECQARIAGDPASVGGGFLQILQQAGAFGVVVPAPDDDETPTGAHVPPSDKAH
ncbi:MAG TPA: hypothetical protein PKO45_15645 [Rubrivivax sp.]|nr:hypothetical protein [Rubrivivax sp.]